MSKRNLRARQEAQKRIKLAELRREVKYGETTLLRAEKEWKKLCVQISLPKLREELILSWHSFEKLMDTKNFVISLYMDEVRDHEEQYMMNIRNHQDNIKQLMDQLAKALNEIHQDNNTKLNNLIRKSLEEWDQNIMATDHAEAYLKIMSYALEMKRKKHEKQTKTEDFAKVNEAASRNAHDIQQITFYLELKFENTWSRIKNIQNDYFLHTQEHQRAHDAIRDVDDANNRTVRKELKKLVNLCELAKRLSTKYKELTGSIGKKLAYLETEKEYLNECFFAFRNKLKQDRDNDSIKRTLMTVEFVKTFDYLKSKLKKGNQMIETLRVSRRYETHPEKVLPYPYEIIEESKIKGLPIMTLFWQRLSEICFE
ncbi:hypothetical protein HHI36_013476 [Cryptolaemus montrouzieri]|uniref:Dynein regulatory complex subunit 2 n=1 Tax=Cryptolaemus montrouzieri TaxID=559131 RepID=A0ABD2NI82_9CUCU